MKQLLVKIREAADRKDSQAKCALISEVYEQMNAKMGKMASDTDISGLEVDVRAFDEELDKLESICSEIVKILNPELQKVLSFLKPRFEAHMYRHQEITWEQVEKRLCEAGPKKLWALNEMEKTGGEPDVVGVDKETVNLIFQDRSVESPTGRRNCVYDKDAENKLKREWPDLPCNGNAVDMAAGMGVELLNEEEYREAQKVERLDETTKNWLKTPTDKRRKDVALHGYWDRGRVVIGDGTHDAPMRVRGFRASLMV
jgi:hypothetical protein